MKTEILKISRRVGLIDLFKEKEFKVGVEIGTDRGGYAKDICERYPELKLYTIDPWKAYTEGPEEKSQFEVDEIYKIAQATLEPYKNCTIIRETSIEAVKRFNANSIDFVFIDGNHEYEYVYQDIVEWTKIVRPGGIVSGHDYREDKVRKYGVIEAVNRYIEENDIEPLYILRKGTFTTSWAFVKGRRKYEENQINTK